MRRTTRPGRLGGLMLAALLGASACALSDGVPPADAPRAASPAAGASSEPASTITDGTVTTEGGSSPIDSPAPSATAATTAPACSTEEFAYTLPVAPELPEPVSLMRRDIAAAAMSCDVAGLAELAAPGGFTYVDPPEADFDPVRFWEQGEDLGSMPLQRLVRILALPPETGRTDGTEVFYWPSAAAYDTWSAVPEAERDLLAGLVEAGDLERFGVEDRYSGPSAAIDETGDWLFYLMGDNG